jgi:hypothetical protein
MPRLGRQRKISQPDELVHLSANRFIAIIEFTKEVQQWNAGDVTDRIRAGLPWGSIILEAHTLTNVSPQVRILEPLFWSTN